MQSASVLDLVDQFGRIFLEVTISKSNVGEFGFIRLLRRYECESETFPQDYVEQDLNLIKLRFGGDGFQVTWELSPSQQPARGQR